MCVKLHYSNLKAVPLLLQHDSTAATVKTPSISASIDDDFDYSCTPHSRARRNNETIVKSFSANHSNASLISIAARPCADGGYLIPVTGNTNGCIPQGNATELLVDDIYLLIRPLLLPTTSTFPR